MLLSALVVAGCGTGTPRGGKVAPGSTAASAGVQEGTGKAPGAAAQVPASEPVKLRVGSVASGATRYMVEYIKAHQMDKKFGFDLEPVYMDLPALGRALQQGTIDINAALQPSTTAIANARENANLIIFGPTLWAATQFVAPVAAQGQKLGDFKGKKLGNLGKNTGGYFFAAVLGRLQSIDVDRNFQPIYSEAPALIGLLQRGELDLSVMFEPYTTRLVQSGRFRVLFDFDQQFEKLVGSKALKTGLGARREWVERNPALAANFRKLFLEAAAQIQRGEDKAFFGERGAQLFGLNSPQLVEAAYPTVAASVASQWEAGDGRNT